LNRTRRTGDRTFRVVARLARLLVHRQTKEAATDKPNLRSPRHISTLPIAAMESYRLQSAERSSKCALLSYSLGFFCMADHAWPTTAFDRQVRTAISPHLPSEDSSHGTTVRIFPRARDIGSKYNGCQLMQDVDHWITIASSRLKMAMQNGSGRPTGQIRSGFLSIQERTGCERGCRQLRRPDIANP
jgi:hypothetical protein